MVTHLSPRAATLLEELREECQTVLELLAQLELPAFKKGRSRINWES